METPLRAAFKELEAAKLAFDEAQRRLSIARVRHHRALLEQTKEQDEQLARNLESARRDLEKGARF